MPTSNLILYNPKDNTDISFKGSSSGSSTTFLGDIATRGWMTYLLILHNHVVKY